MPDATNLAEVRRRLVEARLRSAAARTNLADAIPRADRDGSLPLSFSQQRLWFVDQLGAGTAYNVQLVLQLDGQLDRAALERSVSAVIARHESLRTTFPVVNGEPCQVVSPAGDIPLETTDLRDLAAGERATERDRIVASDCGRSFDLAVGPLVRGRVVELTGDATELVLTIHHIATDAWSMVVLERELLELYAAFRDGVAATLPDLPIQYPDFAVWQRQRMTGPHVNGLLDYWRAKMAGAPMLDLGDRPRSATIANEGGRASIPLTPALAEGLTALAREHQATTTMVTLAAFLVLLGRHANQTDLVIGLPVTGRERSELERLVGFFVNNLPIRVDISDDPTFTDLLARIKKTTLAAYDHQDLPFERLIEEIQPERQSGSNPLFEVVFAMRNVRRSAIGGADGKTLPVGRRTVANLPSSRFDLELHMTDGPDGLTAGFVYRKAIFDDATIELMGDHYRTLLEGIVGAPATRTSQLPLMRATERERLLTEWRGTSSGFPREATIHELFAEEAARRPDAVALAFGDDQVTYRELDERANRLAHRLVGLGVGPEVMVGLCVERSVEMVVGILAILKAGGAYVPLDPEYPAERLSYMASDTNLRVLLTLDRLRSRLPAFDGPVLALDADWPAIEAEPSSPPAVHVGGSSLAYVIYTSGSTGRPKGVCVSHRNVVRLVRGADFVELGVDEVLLQFAPISFDASTLELWGSLLNGARLEIFPPHLPTLDELGRFIEDRGVTTLWLTAALFQQLVDEQFGRLRGVRQLLAGGEALSAPHVRRGIAQLGAEQRLINGYGPTENTTFTCCHRMQAGDEFGRSVPIGRPIADTTVYILDRHLEPVPVGVPGRLYTGGDGVGRCYLNDPRLTAARFVPDPFGDNPGGRLYDTGDLARWLPGGTIEFVGRKDDQVKIRGFRVELGEIETALLELPAVKAAAVITLADENASQRAVAYVVPANGAAPAASELRSALSRRLPEYMVPTQYVTLEELPLSVNGKVDRGALPAPEEIVSDSAYVEPRTATERRLADVWMSFLPVDRVGIHDNFFELGGHSLVATRVLNELRVQTGVELPLVCLFDTPTVAGLAAAIDVLRDNGNGQGPATTEPREQIRI